MDITFEIIDRERENCGVEKEKKNIIGVCVCVCVARNLFPPSFIAYYDREIANVFLP